MYTNQYNLTLSSSWKKPNRKQWGLLVALCLTCRMKNAPKHRADEWIQMNEWVDHTTNTHTPAFQLEAITQRNTLFKIWVNTNYILQIHKTTHPHAHTHTPTHPHLPQSRFHTLSPCHFVPGHSTASSSAAPTVCGDKHLASIVRQSSLK